ncbi:MAG: hypothetical protein ABRQ24_00025 [Syntrophomonadaceae bacterium]
MSKIVEFHCVTRTDPIGSCIYCGSQDDLTDEHVIPYGISGQLILPKASCKKCAGITSAFEGTILGGFMNKARIVGKYPTRRPKKRSTTLPLEINRSGNWETVELPIEDHPGLMMLPRLAPPSKLVGREQGPGENYCGMDTICFNKNYAATLKSLGATEMRVSETYHALSFSRFLAKIAYCYAVARIGLMPREMVPILPLILGESDDASVWVGSSDLQVQIEGSMANQVIGLGCFPNPEDNNRDMLVAHINLFNSSGAGGQDVIVFCPPGRIVFPNN